MSHIIGRPNDDLLDIMLGHGADPEQAFIDGSDQGLVEGAEEEDLQVMSVGPDGVRPGPPGDELQRLGDAGSAEVPARCQP